MRVWDSTAELRYLVLPERPAGTEGLSEDALAALVTRDSMVGVAKVTSADGRSDGMNGVHDMGGHAGHGSDPAREERAGVSRALGRTHAGNLVRAAEPGASGTSISAAKRREFLPPVGISAHEYYEQLRYAQVVELLAVQRHGDARRDRKRTGGERAHTKAVPPLTAGDVAAWFDRWQPDETRCRGRSEIQGAASACAPATSILRPTRACRAMHAARPASSSAITACSSSPTPTPKCLGEKPQHVYSVRFAARELWGEQALAARHGSSRHVGRLPRARSDP